MSDTVLEANGYPRVGIRPIIDGRAHGIREELEDQVRGMAERAARLISSRLFYSDGSPVQCVIPPFSIGGSMEAAKCDRFFAGQDVGLTLSVTPCWCYGTETMDMDPLRPKAVWGFNGTERPGAVYLAAVLAGHAQSGLPAFGIYGHDVQDSGDETICDDVAVKILRFVRAGLAVAQLRGRSYLACGGVSMGIAGSMGDPAFFQDYLGMRFEQIDLCEFERRIEQEIYDKVEYERAIVWTRKNCKEGKDWNSKALQQTRAEKDAAWAYSVKTVLIMRDLMEGNPVLAKEYPEEAQGHNALISGFQGQRQWTDYRPNGDFLEAILNSSFDWNGIRAPYLVATENDTLNGASMAFMNLMSNRAQLFADVRTYWSPESVKRVTGEVLTGMNAGGFIHLINSGAACLDATGKQREDGQPAMKPFWDISEAERDACLEATRWCPANRGYMRAGGWSSSFLSEGGMAMTMIRLGLVKGFGPVLYIAEGWSTDLPGDMTQQLMERTDPAWPCTWFVPRLTGKGVFRDVYSVMNAWNANHGAISYGHVGADVMTLAAMLRIPVAMSNVAEDLVFRPHVWGFFGCDDLVGADYRACQHFGPLYK